MLTNVFIGFVMLFALLHGLEKLSVGCATPEFDNIFDFIFDIRRKK